MQSITFECEVITPMFLNGADGKTPELRAPSIKGALRFWWRAMNGHLRLEELEKQEIEIFGGVGLGNLPAQRSSIVIQLFDTELETINYPMLPHRIDDKQYGFPSYADAFDSKEKFKIKLIAQKERVFSIEKLKALFELTCLLGGLGKRVRRGMGSVKIIGFTQNNEATKDYSPSSTISEIETLIRVISPHFSTHGNAIINTYTGGVENYGWIKQIELGTKPEPNFRRLLSKAGKTASDLKRDKPYNYEVSLGHAFKGRFASPIYVSIIEKDKGFIPIITTLNTVPDRDKEKIDLTLQEKFKKALL